MLSSLMRKYWFINANSAAKKVLSIVLLADATEENFLNKRWQTYPWRECWSMKPSSFMLEIDYFGPIEVKRGRGCLKRYGVLFTCMTSHAVHLEVAYTLDTDSCINAVRLFICRQGLISTLRSDNGTNFAESYLLKSKSSHATRCE